MTPIREQLLDRSQRAKIRQETVEKLYCIKIKHLDSKNNFKKMKRQATDWEKMIANHIYDKGLESKILGWPKSSFG